MVNTNYVYLSDAILERAKQMYGGKVGKLNDSQTAGRAYFTVRAQQTDIQQGIAIANVLRNAKGKTRNMILCRLAEDNRTRKNRTAFWRNCCMETRKQTAMQKPIKKP